MNKTLKTLLIPFVLLLGLSACSPSGENIPRSQDGLVDSVEVDRLRQQSQQLVSKALSFMEDEKIYNAHGTTPGQCSSIFYKYDIFKLNSELYVHLNIHFEGSEGMKRDVRYCLAETMDYFEQYGLNLRITTADNKDESHTAVDLIDEEGRSNAYNWYKNDIVECQTVAHEVAHLLGLPDEYYEEDTCRTQQFEAHETFPHSTMAVSGHKFYGVELLPRHTLAILEQALPAEIHINNIQEGRTFGETLPSCRLTLTSSADEELLKSQQRIQLVEGQFSSHISGYERSPYFYVDGLFENNSVSDVIECYNQDQVHTLGDWENLFLAADIQASLLPFSFQDHKNFAPLYRTRQ